MSNPENASLRHEASPEGRFVSLITTIVEAEDADEASLIAARKLDSNSAHPTGEFEAALKAARSDPSVKSQPKYVSILASPEALRVMMIQVRLQAHFRDTSLFQAGTMSSLVDRWMGIVHLLMERGWGPFNEVFWDSETNTSHWDMIDGEAFRKIEEAFEQSFCTDAKTSRKKKVLKMALGGNTKEYKEAYLAYIEAVISALSEIPGRRQAVNAFVPENFIQRVEKIMKWADDDPPLPLPTFRCVDSIIEIIETCKNAVNEILFWFNPLAHYAPWCRQANTSGVSDFSATVFKSIRQDARLKLGTGDQAVYAVFLFIITQCCDSFIPYSSMLATPSCRSLRPMNKKDFDDCYDKSKVKARSTDKPKERLTAHARRASTNPLTRSGVDFDHLNECITHANSWLPGDGEQFSSADAAVSDDLVMRIFGFSAINFKGSKNKSRDFATLIIAAKIEASCISIYRKNALAGVGGYIRRQLIEALSLFWESGNTLTSTIFRTPPSQYLFIDQVEQPSTAALSFTSVPYDTRILEAERGKGLAELDAFIQGLITSVENSKFATAYEEEKDVVDARVSKAVSNLVLELAVSGQRWLSREDALLNGKDNIDFNLEEYVPMEFKRRPHTYDRHTVGEYPTTDAVAPRKGKRKRVEKSPEVTLIHSDTELSGSVLESDQVTSGTDDEIEASFASKKPKKAKTQLSPPDSSHAAHGRDVEIPGLDTEGERKRSLEPEQKALDYTQNGIRAQLVSKTEGPIQETPGAGGSTSSGLQFEIMSSNTLKIMTGNLYWILENGMEET